MEHGNRLSLQQFRKKYETFLILVILGMFLSLTCIDIIVFSPSILLNNLRDCPDIKANNDYINKGLVLYFTFNEESLRGRGNKIVCDFSGNKNNGAVSNLFWNATGGIHNDGAFDFNGNEGQILVPDADELSPSNSNQQFTVSFFIKFNTKDFVGEGYNEEYINYIGKGSPDKGYEWAFRQYNEQAEGRADRLSFYAFNLQGGLGAGSYFQDSIKTKEWIYITGVINGTDIKIYKNGILRGSNPLEDYNIELKNGQADISIGASSGNRYFNGTIDELRIYNRSLTDKEIKMMYDFSSKI